MYFKDQNVMQTATHRTEFWNYWNSKKENIPTDGDQRVDAKNGVIYLIIIFTPRFIVIKMSKMVHFSYFLLMTAENQSQFGKII